jgi:hypothetical protein
VTVQDWLDARVPAPPAVLMHGLRTALGADAGADAERTTEACLSAADRALRAILDAEHFDRDGALDLLVVDALTTFAYEYATVAQGADLGALAGAGIRRFGDAAAPHG